MVIDSVRVEVVALHPGARAVELVVGVEHPSRRASWSRRRLQRRPHLLIKRATPALAPVMCCVAGKTCRRAGLAPGLMSGGRSGEEPAAAPEVAPELGPDVSRPPSSEEHTSELQSREN